MGSRTVYNYIIYTDASADQSSNSYQDKLNDEWKIVTKNKLIHWNRTYWLLCWSNCHHWRAKKLPNSNIQWWVSLSKIKKEKLRSICQHQQNYIPITPKQWKNDYAICQQFQIDSSHLLGEKTTTNIKRNECKLEERWRLNM